MSGTDDDNDGDDDDDDDDDGDGIVGGADGPCVLVGIFASLSELPKRSLPHKCRKTSSIYLFGIS